MSNCTTVRLWLLWENGKPVETDKARRFSRVPPERHPQEDDLVWLPRSSCHRITKFGMQPGDPCQECEVEIEDWLAEQKGLI